MITKAVIEAEASKWGIPAARLASLWIGKHHRKYPPMIKLSNESPPSAKRPALDLVKHPNVIYLPALPLS